MSVNYKAIQAPGFLQDSGLLQWTLITFVEVQITRHLIGVSIHLGIPRLKLQPRSSIKHFLKKRNCFFERWIIFSTIWHYFGTGVVPFLGSKNFEAHPIVVAVDSRSKLDHGVCWIERSFHGSGCVSFCAAMSEKWGRSRWVLTNSISICWWNTPGWTYMVQNVYRGVWLIKTFTRLPTFASCEWLWLWPCSMMYFMISPPGTTLCHWFLAEPTGTKRSISLTSWFNNWHGSSRSWLV